MADTEIQEQHVPSLAADTKSVEEEPKEEAVKEPKSPVPLEDKTLTLDSGFHLLDANEEVCVQESVVDQSEKKIRGDDGQEENALVESSAPLKGEPSAPQVVVENVKKWKTWLLSDSERLELQTKSFSESRLEDTARIRTMEKELLNCYKEIKKFILC